MALLSTGTGGTIVGVLLLLYKTCNKKKIRMKCCGYDMSASVDIGDITPENITLPISHNPQSEPSFVVNNPLGRDAGKPV